MNRLNFRQLLALYSLLFTSFSFAGLTEEVKFAIDGLDHSNCKVQAGRISKMLNSMTPEGYQEEMKAGTYEGLLGQLWEAKISLHQKMRSIHQSGLTSDCANSIRSSFWAIRMSEDIISDDFYRKNKDSRVFPDHSFEFSDTLVQRAAEFKNINLRTELKSGDIILSRGNAYTSAAIANLGEFDTQFSHLSVVYKDPQGKFWTVEAHIEVGSFVRPLEDHIDDKNFRTMVYRFDDENVAQKAAEYIFNKVKKASDTTGNILYDFGFDLDDYSKLFCSEVATLAYDFASEGKYKLPQFRSSLIKRKVDFVRLLGLYPDTSFIPADIEIDPRFKIVSEWRDSARVQDILEKDAIIQSMFDWHDRFGYRLVQGSSFDSFIYRNIAWPMRRVPFLKKYFKDKLPINMSRKLIGYFGVLNTFGKESQKLLKKADDEMILKRGLPLTREEKIEVMDKIRLDDLSGKKKLHKMYRPRTK